MKITDVSLTLFAWESIPSTTYGHHTARPIKIKDELAAQEPFRLQPSKN